MFIAWLHQETNYTFNGSAPITGLTVREELTLQLGHLILQEQKEEQRRHDGQRRKYSEPRRSTTEAMDEFTDRFPHGYD